jgi:hypothetical protein
MAGIHLTLIVALVVGGPLSLRWPRLVRVHLVIAIAVGGVFVVGADCPLTVWQKACLRRAGRSAYQGGFIEHHLVTPVTGTGITPAITALIVAVWVVPAVVSYSVMWRRHRSTATPRTA